MSTWAILRAQVDVARVVGVRLPLKSEGRHWIARCPFHEDGGRPNLVLYPDGGFKCFACGARGDVFDLVAKLDGVSLGEATRLVARTEHLGPAPAAPAPSASLASVDQRDAVYRALLAACPLSAPHRAQLLARGLSPAALRTAGYGSWGGGFGRDITAQLLDRGLSLAGVPGFAQDTAGGWWIRAMPGLLIPVRDPAGRIQGCQIRADEAGTRRYRWLSSAGKPAGPSPGSPAHCAGFHDAGPDRWLWVTEGPLKADVASALLGAPVIGVTGVTAWRRALPAIRAVRPGVMILAFDQDADPTTRAAVSRNLAGLADALARLELPVLTAQWQGAKGLDDVLAGGGTVVVRAWSPEAPLGPEEGRR